MVERAHIAEGARRAVTGTGRPFLARILSSEHPFPWLFPISAMLVLFGVYPLLYAIWLSLHKRNPVTRLSVFEPAWNWMKIFGDQRVWGAIGHTYLYTGCAIVIELALGLLIALLLDSDRKGYGVLRALMTLPLVVPPAVAGMMFLLMLDGSFGVLSRGLYAMGLWSPAHPILATSSSALYGILLTDIWQWTPFMVLIMMAGLRALPKGPFEAAAIDGATAVQAFFRLTLPMLSKIIALAVLIRGVDLFRIYDYIKVMTEGGPGTSTETLTAYAGAIYFKNADFPYASTVALLTLILVVATSTLFMKIFRVRF
ncbi:MAG TPA: sugar ABC transporter permease [Hypericibacter adhaerens]|uniref:ABC transporter permease n=1 Tax=Hypericibacter adhaerens TaxID=2602016 RepID=A0A5J6MVB3_9PROT|nr:sugar ABC transporter permease [Hypericibacter adhaerens]QEX21134.1 ABC transporter permease [Hypericibacter adhaerens]HWA44175.1 sugar ABC transporter permease [Hypericibacter adhaerens]